MKSGVPPTRIRLLSHQDIPSHVPHSLCLWGHRSVTKVLSFESAPNYDLGQRIEFKACQCHLIRHSSSPLSLAQAAQEFATEVSGAAERNKKTLPSPVGLQLFLLYVRGQGYVPAHQVAGLITVQTIFGDARLTAGGHSSSTASILKSATTRRNSPVNLRSRRSSCPGLAATLVLLRPALTCAPQQR